MPTTVNATPSTNTAGWLGKRAAEMPSWAAVVVSMTATCWAVSFSYALSGEPATIDNPIAATATPTAPPAPAGAASGRAVGGAEADSAGEPVTGMSSPSGRVTGHHTP